MLTYRYDLTNQKPKCQIFQASHSDLFVLSLQAFKIAIDRAAQYITSNSKKIESLYARAIASYALTLTDIHSMSAVSLYEKIKTQAQVDGKILFGTLLTKKSAQIRPSHIFNTIWPICPHISHFQGTQPQFVSGRSPNQTRIY